MPAHAVPGLSALAYGLGAKRGHLPGSALLESSESFSGNASKNETRRQGQVHGFEVRSGAEGQVRIEGGNIWLESAVLEAGAGNAQAAAWVG
jgi:hypothetical protein